jgi:putative membrane protein
MISGNLDQRQSNRVASLIILAVSAAATVFLFWIIYFREGSAARPDWVSGLPLFNALCNALSASFLGLGVWAIKNKNEILHRNLLLSAFGASAAFLVGYVLYYVFSGNTPFTTQGWIRPVYFFILISHVLLSIVALPMVLANFYLGLTNQRSLHRRFSKLVFPIWMYVSVTGVLVYLILRVITGHPA